MLLLACCTKKNEISVFLGKNQVVEKVLLCLVLMSFGAFDE